MKILKPNDIVMLKIAFTVILFLTALFSVVLCAINPYWKELQTTPEISLPIDVIAYMVFTVLSIVGLMVLSSNFKK